MELNCASDLTPRLIKVNPMLLKVMTLVGTRDTSEFLVFDPLPSLGQRASKNVLLPDVDHPHLPHLDCGHIPRWNFQQIAFRLIELEGFCLHGECLSGRQEFL